jgi:hypothetical protein
MGIWCVLTYPDFPSGIAARIWVFNFATDFVGEILLRLPFSDELVTTDRQRTRIHNLIHHTFRQPLLLRPNQSPTRNTDQEH